MKKVLIISYYFPPVGGAGVFRILKFTKFLPQFDWQPTIIASELPNYFWQDTDLENEIPQNLEIFRTPFKNPLDFLLSKKGGKRQKYSYPKSDFFFLPDNKRWWHPYLYKAGKRILEKDKHDLIFVSMPPFTGGLTAARLSKKYNIPLVADFRDSWHNSPPRPKLPPIHFKYNTDLEKKVLKQAKAVTSVNRSIIEDIIDIYPNSCQTHLIPNGFDPEDIPENTEEIETPELTIKYIGTVHESFRYPAPFLEALRLLKKDDKLHNLKVEFIGKVPESFTQLINELGLSDIVKNRGFVNHYEAIKEAIQSDILLLYINVSAVRQTTSKLYEYLGIGKPILGLVPFNGEASRLIRSNNAGWIASPESPSKISEAMDKLLKLKSKGEIPKMKTRDKYLRKNLTSDLAEVFNSVLVS